MKENQDTQPELQGKGINHMAATAGGAGVNSELEERLEAVEAEWDEEQAIQLSTAVLALAGTALGILVNKRWFALPVLAAAFLGQHSIQGWSPMVPLFQRFGFRKRQVIEKEKYALKAQRGDFRRTVNNPDKAWKAVNS
jgi:hypothetical protein